MAQAIFQIDYSVSERGKKARAWDFNSDLDGRLTIEDLLKYTKEALISISQEALKEEQGRGFDKNPVTIVDNKVGRSINTVSPVGKIEFVTRLDDLRPVILGVYTDLLDKSKVVTGEYQQSHFVYFRNQLIATSLSELIRWTNSDALDGFKDRDQIRFINVAPYARRLERMGVTKDRTKSATRQATRDELRRKLGNNGRVLVPNGVYSLTYRSVKRRFKGNFFVAFDLVLGSQINLTGPGRVFKTGSTPGRPYLYPSIVIGVASRAIKGNGVQQ